MSHYIKKCECGIVLEQCRCPDANKAVHVVSPCVHKKLAPPLEIEA